MAFQKTDGVIEGIGNLIAEHLTTGSLSLGEAGNVVRVDVSLNDGQVVLRTDRGEVWYLLPIRLGTRASIVISHGKMPDFGHEEVRRSYHQYVELEKQWKIVLRVVEAAGGPDNDVALQAWVEDVLNEEDRECWFRWSPGGYATPEEHKIVKNWI